MMRDELRAYMESIKRFMGAAADLIVLNILLIVCCLPVVTAGAAMVAAYEHMMRIVRGQETGFPFKTFFADFGKAFKQATGAWMLLLLCLAVLAGDYYFAMVLSNPTNTFFLVFSIVMAVVLLFAATWLFPLMARYNNTIRGHIKNAFLMAAAMFPQTLLAFLVQLAVIALPVLIPELFYYVGWLWVLFGLSFPMYMTAVIYRKPLDCMPKLEEEIGQD